jgi:hypothetical protein
MIPTKGRELVEMYSNPLKLTKKFLTSAKMWANSRQIKEGGNS